MREDDDRVDQVLAHLSSALARTIVQRYRIEVDAAEALVREAWATDEALRQQAAKDPDPARLARTRAYKQAAERAKTKIYYHLRCYRRDDAGLDGWAERLRGLAAAGARAADEPARAARDAVVAAHVSTRERLDDLPAFWHALFALVPEPTSIVDLRARARPQAGAGRGPAGARAPRHPRRGPGPAPARHGRQAGDGQRVLAGHHELWSDGKGLTTMNSSGLIGVDHEAIRGRGDVHGGPALAPGDELTSA